MSRKLTTQQFIQKAKAKHGDTYIYEKTQYTGRSTKVIITCKIHGDFEQNAGNHLNGQGCPKCGNIRSGDVNRDNGKSFISKAKKVHKGKYDYSKVEYKGTNTKVVIICKEHGDFEQTPNSHLQKHGCPKCAVYKNSIMQTNTVETIAKKSLEVHGKKYKYKYLKKRYSNKDSIDIYCEKHGWFNQTVKNHNYHQEDCPQCATIQNGLNRRKDTKYFIEKSKEHHGDLYDYSNANYIKRNKKVTIICKLHGEFKQLAGNHMTGTGCPKCVSVGPSKAEQEMYEFVNDMVSAEQSNRTVLEGKELDIYIPSKKLAIEYDGLYYHSDKFKDKNYHLEKTKLCKEKGVRLIHIFEDEWLNKRKLVKSRIKNLMGTSDKVYARKTVVKEVPTREVMDFLQKNHIQGKVGAKIKLGLYYNEELVSLMTFGKLRKNLGSTHKEGHYELLRFCNKLNTSVVGGASKLLKNFQRNHEYKEIISYCDLRWSQGNLYEKLGFIQEHISVPNYFYITQSSPNIREPRFKYRKNILVEQGFDKSKTEKQIMKERGFLRIYDCGTIKYKL